MPENSIFSNKFVITKQVVGSWITNFCQAFDRELSQHSLVGFVLATKAFPQIKLLQTGMTTSLYSHYNIKIQMHVEEGN